MYYLMILLLENITYTVQNYFLVSKRSAENIKQEEVEAKNKVRKKIF